MNCTSIEQSKELMKVLPEETADLYWIVDTYGEIVDGKSGIVWKEPCTPRLSFGKPVWWREPSIVKHEYFPAWSLYALINALSGMTDKTMEIINLKPEWKVCSYWYEDNIVIYEKGEDLLDTVYEFTLKLIEYIKGK